MFIKGKPVEVAAIARELLAHGANVNATNEVHPLFAVSDPPCVLAV